MDRSSLSGRKSRFNLRLHATAVVANDVVGGVVVNGDHVGAFDQLAAALLTVITNVAIKRVVIVPQMTML